MTGPIVIFGSGPAGVDIARALACAGISATLIEPDPHAADRARFFLGKDVTTAATITITDDPTQAYTAGFVFEALGAPTHVRVEALTALVQNLPEQIPIALTSIADLSRITFADALNHRLIGFQVFAPAHLRHLVEITAPPDTAPMAFALARLIGKTPVCAPADCPTIGTRMLRRLNHTADCLLINGAIPFELDEAMVAFGFDIGFYAAQDQIGLDVAYAERKHVEPTQRYIPISDRMVEEGRLGQKVGVGWYRYPGGGGAVIDPLVEDLIHEEARFENITTREYSTSEIQNHIGLALVHEAAQILLDQATSCAADINLVSIAGLGFPADTGGVITWADTRGVVNINAALSELAVGDPEFTPGPVLSDCAKHGIRLADWRP